MSGSSFDWEAYDEAALARKQILVEELGYRPSDAQAIVQNQDQEVRMRLDEGRPVEPMLRSIAVEPATTQVLPEAQLQELEARQAASVAEQQDVTLGNEPPEPDIDPYPAVYAELKQDHANAIPPERNVDDLEAFLAASREMTERDGRGR